MGYGDLAIQNIDSKIPTPNLDKLAKEGMRFTNAHSSSGISTPSRYALLTGRYHWRKFHNIVDTWELSVIDEEEITMSEMLKQNGFKTACIGKWHLGWDWQSIRKTDAKPIMVEKKQTWGPDAYNWDKPIAYGPVAHGFDYYFGDDVPNFPPYCWIENDRIIEAPTELLTVKTQNNEMITELRPGASCKDWNFYEVMPTITKKAVAWISNQMKNQPFFLFLL